jgi:soluble lytic murein transglycosylase-like protein
MSRPLTLAALALICCTSNAAASVGSCEREISAAALKFGVPEGILYSVGLTETGRKGSLQPFALNVEGKAYYFDGLDQALDAFQEARQGGAKLIDVGCMQINQHFHGEHFTSVQAMFDPQRNVEYAARFLSNLHQRTVSCRAEQRPRPEALCLSCHR